MMRGGRRSPPLIAALSHLRAGPRSLKVSHNLLVNCRTNNRSRSADPVTDLAVMGVTTRKWSDCPTR